jgi:hypothetical protein
MLLGFGWCVLRSSRELCQSDSVESVYILDERTQKTDEDLWASFRQWMSANEDPWLKWQLFEALNNHHGLLQFCISRNHRSTKTWEMLKWIASNGPDSYGLFYVHDDEDDVGVEGYGRGTTSFSNEFRVHRILKGEIAEFPDPFLSPIVPTIDPSFPA